MKKDKQFNQFYAELISALDDAAKRLLHDVIKGIIIMVFINLKLQEPYDLKFDNRADNIQIDPPEFSNFRLTNGPSDQIVRITNN